MQTAMIEELKNAAVDTDGLEAALQDQIPGYAGNSMQIYGVSNHTEAERCCVIGSYFDIDLVPANQYTGFYAVNIGGYGFSSANWIVYEFGQWTAGSAVPTLNGEQGGMFGLVEIPLASTNFTQGWVIVGSVGDDTFTIPPGDLFLSPIIVNVALDGSVTFIASQYEGTNKPESWLLTAGGVDANTRPMLACDVVYDAQNDACVAVGGALGTAATSVGYSMLVEITTNAAMPTYTYSINYGLSQGAGWENLAFFRSCEIQTQDAAGASVSNRTIVTAIGYAQNLTANPTLVGNAIWGVYQPNFSNAWPSVAPRLAWVDRGTASATDFYNAVGLSDKDKPSDLTLVKRLTADGEDIYLIGGACPNGAFAWAMSGLTTDSTGGGADNIINQTGANTELAFAELRNVAADVAGNIPSNSSLVVAEGNTVWDAVAFSQRKTKLYAFGWVQIGVHAPITPSWAIGSKKALILATSRGLNKWGGDKLYDSYGAMVTNVLTIEGAYLKLDLFSSGNVPNLFFGVSPYRTGAGISALGVAQVATGNTAKAWFEYLMYDGVDALVAKKLHEMGVRVTIANVEWYKQDILKERLDVSSDFFTEWATAQEEQNQERERLNGLQGKSRLRKRQVRTEVFDDYADMEEKEAAVKNFPDYDPFKDGEPFKDDVAREQEIQKTQKAVDDLRRIEDKVDEIADNQEEQREQDGAYDIGDNEEP